MGRPEFVHLHVHTDYSLLDGACETGELLDEASRQKMPAVAITDHGNLFAAANFFNEASKRDVKPIIGCEVYVAKGSRHDRGEKSASTPQTTVMIGSLASAVTITWCCFAKTSRATTI